MRYTVRISQERTNNNIMKKLIAALTIAAFAVAVHAGEGCCPKSKAACADKDKAACAEKAAKSGCGEDKSTADTEKKSDSEPASADKSKS